MSTSRVLSDFAGHWRLTKQMSPAEGPTARFEGAARFTPVADGLAYEEKGRLQVGAGAPLEAVRRYVWRPGLEIFFEDGRYFHTVPAEGGTARHWCAPDAYVVTYDFTNWPQFDARWRVHGPRKDYVMLAQYARAD